MFWDRKENLAIHLIGIGGSGMSGIAEVLLASGFRVSGSDAQLSDTTSRLEKLGARIFHGHDSSFIQGATCVVVSSAVSRDNPEWVTARAQRIPVIQRAEMLAELMRLKMGVAVAGSHGKTTTTSLLGQLLQPLDPTVVVGGRVQHWKASTVVGQGPLFVIEADESDRSFLKFSPIYSVVTNIDLEHLDTYRDLQDLEETFLEFLNRTAFFGQNWICRDCSSLEHIRSRISKPTRTYGFHPESDLRIISHRLESHRSFFELEMEKTVWEKFEIPLTGRHNVLNVTGAIGAAFSLGVSVENMRQACCTLRPVDRRLHVHQESSWVAIVEDYGHHPTEIRATLEALQVMYPNRKKIVYFQPHRFTRTQALWSSFTTCFSGLCDTLFLLPIYSAHEPAINGISSELLSKEIHGVSAHYRSTVPEAKTILALLPEEPSVVLILGAGPLTSLALALSHLVDSPCQNARRRSV